MSNSLLLKETIEKYFKKIDELDKQIFSQLALYIYYLESKKTESDLYILAKLLPEEYLERVISFYDGASLKLPKNEDYKKTYLLAICYYLKEIKHWGWDQIKAFVPIPKEYQDILSSISIGKRINLISENMSAEFISLLTNYDIENLIKKMEGKKNVRKKRTRSIRKNKKYKFFS